jgi:hypothetical protein
MDPALAKIVRHVQGRVHENPEEAPVDPGMDLQLGIVRFKSKLRFTEDDVIQAAMAVGVAEKSVLDWVGNLASWV